MPNLKNFSSPWAVRPPIYILSAPRTSLNPSELASLPRRRCAWCGMGIARGECSCLAACAAAAAVAVADAAAPGLEEADDGVETE